MLERVDAMLSAVDSVDACSSALRRAVIQCYYYAAFRSMLLYRCRY